MADTPVVPAVAPHGSHRLPAVDVDSYNVELKDNEGFMAIAPAGARFAI
jgi:hypothetical protein